jgi:hypothetical protein
MRGRVATNLNKEYKLSNIVQILGDNHNILQNCSDGTITSYGYLRLSEAKHVLKKNDKKYNDMPALKTALAPAINVIYQ